MFSDILITSDYDHTLTAKDGSIPERNLAAIRYFMENGGTFTVNTGRSLPMCTLFRDIVPMNAPLLTYNGGLAYDTHADRILFCHTIDLDPQTVVAELQALFPDLVTEIEGVNAHYLFRENPMWNDFCANNRCPAKVTDFSEDLGPFLKFCVYGPLRDNTVAGLYTGTPAEHDFYDEVEAVMKAKYSDRCAVYRAAHRIVDVHPKAASKLNAARQLQKMLGKQCLITVGDGENDVSMLEGADFGFCPADSRIRNRFENVCSCAEGAVADVIFSKIPQILEKKA